ncbi:MAG: hypothetical protein GY710_05830 [Desulfobacteraceae bacterium]|nr:hypothetical protein [Desulfobacteraceae bacterium]
MRKLSFILLLFFFIISCAHNQKNIDQITWFPKLTPEKLTPREGFWFIENLKGYQQTTEYTCGPASLLSLAKYYGLPNMTADKKTEMRIAKEVGTRSMDVLKNGGKPGTKPGEMTQWLEKNSFKVKLEFEDKEDFSALKKLQDNIKNGIPTLVEWINLTGHWVVAIGYDNRGNDNPMDDVLIFADSYDKYDDYKDGYTFVNARSFYWLWFDAFYFDKTTWRTMITAVPAGKSDKK